MNVKEIIESGLIELYAMNALSATEVAQVEAWAAEFPEVRAEIEEAQAALELYAQAHAMEPPANMKARIMANFDNDFGDKSSKKEGEKPTESPTKGPLSIKPEKTDSSTILGKTLPWAIAGMALVMAISFFIKSKNTASQLTDCQTESAQLVQKQQVIVDLERKIDIIRNINTKPIDLKTNPTNPSLPKDLMVKIYWNAKDKATLLSIQNLPKPPQGKQYQLWAIVGKNPPIDAGVITYDMSLVQPMKVFEKVNAFAITLEREGGSEAPTLNEMKVLGTTTL
jgi:anti-sigma-K factor RskA